MAAAWVPAFGFLPDALCDMHAASAATSTERRAHETGVRCQVRQVVNGAPGGKVLSPAVPQCRPRGWSPPRWHRRSLQRAPLPCTSPAPAACRQKSKFSVGCRQNQSDCGDKLLSGGTSTVKLGGASGLRSAGCFQSALQGSVWMLDHPDHGQLGDVSRPNPFAGEAEPRSTSRLRKYRLSRLSSMRKDIC